jgi:hypothetical protein
MVNFSGAAIGAVTAATAAAERQRMYEEEEQMTRYSDDELQNDWEFKIVRAYRAVFAKPEAFKKLLSEEERAGWILLEKLDNSRVRFKRRRSGQANDAQLISEGIDPYRTQYGTSQMVIVLVIAIIGIIFVFGFMAFIIFLNLRSPGY